MEHAIGLAGLEPHGPHPVTGALPALVTADAQGKVQLIIVGRTHGNDRSCSALMACGICMAALFGGLDIVKALLSSTPHGQGTARDWRLTDQIDKRIAHGHEHRVQQGRGGPQK